ncbi:hypothetical protein [Nocardia coubleae]|uniref:PH (Pleckstrin Homology) domain-containing protein n=1 Tax=Nocardia coubleae TaxID=356147 RepID=A0A846VZZ9_9NOCA|nr:hypothetical protein [Nocardia coubleae]NKX86419.1 hypothetical protein [Nocardia coubleae]
MQPAGPDEVQVYGPSANPISILLCTAGIVAIIISILTITLEENVHAALYAVLITGTAATLYGIQNIRHACPELIVDHDGIVHRLYGRIYWNEISMVRVRRIKVNQPILRDLRLYKELEIILKDPTIAVTRSPERRHSLYTRLASTDGWSPVTISESSILPYATEDVIQNMRLYYPALTVG